MQDISFDLRAGEIHCLCGENGAGKSTLIKVLSGAHQPGRGDHLLRGREGRAHPAPGALAGDPDHLPGAHRLRQPQRHGEHLHGAGGGAAAASSTGARCAGETVEVLQYLQGGHRPRDDHGASSPAAQQKTVEIAKGLVFKRKVIILDEPTASYSAAEIDNLLEIIQAVRASGIGDHLHLAPPGRGVPAGGPGDGAAGRAPGEHATRSQGLSKTQLIKDMVGRDPSTFYQRERVPRRRGGAGGAPRERERGRATSPSRFGAARCSASPG